MSRVALSLIFRKLRAAVKGAEFAGTDSELRRVIELMAKRRRRGEWIMKGQAVGEELFFTGKDRVVRLVALSSSIIARTYRKGDGGVHWQETSLRINSKEQARKLVDFVSRFSSHLPDTRGEDWRVPVGTILPLESPAPPTSESVAEGVDPNTTEVASPVGLPRPTLPPPRDIPRPPPKAGQKPA